MKPIIFAIIIMLIVQLASAQVDNNVFRKLSSKNEEPIVNYHPIIDRQLNLNENWHFHLGEIPGFYVPEFDDADWRVLNIPHDWSIEGQFMFSVGNEVPDQRYADGPKTLKRLIEWAREEDNTRMITATCDWAPWANANGFFDAMDIAGYNIGGFEKTMYYYWQAFWSEKPMVHIAVNLKEKGDFEWRSYNVASNWNFNPGNVDTVFVYSNAEKVELYQNGKSLGSKAVNPNTYQAIYHVDYKEGELMAKAFNKKEIVATHTLKTAGEPKKLVLKDERKSDGTESDRLVFLTLEIQDEKGTRCPFAKNEITVDVNGEGELIGLDSGNQFSHELYKQNKRESHDGRLLLTIHSKGKGKISVQCRAENLESGTINIQN